MEKETNNISEKEKEILDSYEVEEYTFTEEELEKEIKDTPKEDIIEVYEETTTPEVQVSNELLYY